LRRSEHVINAGKRRDAAEIHLLAGRAEVSLDVGPVAGQTAFVGFANGGHPYAGDVPVAEVMDHSHKPQADDADIDHLIDPFFINHQASKALRKTPINAGERRERGLSPAAKWALR